MRTIALYIIALLAPAAFSATSVTRHSITWTFDTDYTVGTFANGDPWVKENTLGAGVTISSVSPAPTTDGTGRYKNGSMRNIAPNGGQGYDSAGRRFNAALSVTYPATVAANSSIVSTVGIEPAGERPSLQDASVLTVLPANVTPPANAFRPPYSGSDKTLYWTTDSIVWANLPSLSPPAGGNVPTIASFRVSPQKDLNRVWLLHEHTLEGRSIHAKAAMFEYGRDLSKVLQSALLRAMLDDTQAAKEPLVIDLIQIGIDIYGNVANGMKYPANGGHNQGMLAPLMFAGHLLEEQGMLDYGDFANYTNFQETQSTFYVTQVEVDYTQTNPNWDPDTRTSEAIPYEVSDIGMPEWGIRHHEYIKFDNKAWGAIYRNVTGDATVGHALALRLIGRDDDLGDPSFFDYYQTRYYPTNVQGDPDFVADMWAAYGDAGSTPAPSAPSGLAATAVSSSQIDLSWVDNSSNESSFRVERSTTSGSGFAEVGSAGADATSYSDTDGLLPGVTYYYRLRARNNGGDSAYSAEASDTTEGAGGTAPNNPKRTRLRGAAQGLLMDR